MQPFAVSAQGPLLQKPQVAAQAEVIWNAMFKNLKAQLYDHFSHVVA